MSHAEQAGRHVDPETLALLAIGEQLSESADLHHLDECPECAAYLRELTTAAAVGRASIDVVDLAAPDPQVWSRIHEQLGLASTIDASSGDVDSVVSTGTVVHSEAADGAEDVAPSGDEEPRGLRAPVTSVTAGVRPIRRIRRRVLVAVAGLAVAASVVGIVLTVTRPAPARVLAAAQLEPLPGWSDVGDAVVEESADGSRTLDVTVDGASDAPEYREVWLITSDLSELVSLGVLEGGSGTFALPEGIDIADYDLVDVSAEPLDGDPAHSGNSIVRGELR